MTASIEQVSGKTFDFIIIGGGTAGLTLAARLSEDTNVSILVLEAGAANLNDPMILTPALFGVHFKNPNYDWAFQTVPQKELGGRSVYWARGKTLGGSSALNFFQFHRPPKWDIDAFEKLGNPGWNWELLKKYFEKSSGFIPPSQKAEAVSYDITQRNTTGPLKYSYPLVLSGFEGAYHEALKSIGIHRLEDLLFGETKGTWITPVTIDPRTQTRSYAANMYYTPNADRKNLTVLVSSQVTKINLHKDSADGIATATGVQFVHEGKAHVVHAKKEVILSAGAIMSPQILELSGIGNKNVLNKVGIETLVDLPGVGENVQEHVYSGTTFEVRKEVEDQYTTFDCLRDPKQREEQKALFAQGKGAFGMAPACMTFLPLANASPDSEALTQDLKQSIKAGVDANQHSPGLQKQYKLQLENIDRGNPTCEIVLAQSFSTTGALPEPGKKYITMTCMINHPFSRGNIHITSNNPLEPPAIDPHYFEEKFDLRLFVELVKLNRRLVTEEPFRNILTEGEVNPGLNTSTDEQIGDYLKKNFSTTFHTVGSCSMLPLEDGGVVSPKLKVYGTANIRVVDISIIPLHIGSHMQSMAYAIGELAADIIARKI
ncbi:alcohol oxidase [Pholiota molesta]|nr:alcohol oxidase [Pholiota molesta]